MARHLKNAPLYPLFLDLNGKPCLVVGAGTIGLHKTTALLRCGARVTVTAIEAVDEIISLSNSGNITFHQRNYHNGEAGKYHLVIAATDDDALNQRIRDDAHKTNALVNVVDVPRLCDFYVPAIIRRGRLQVAISTGGSSPSMAKRLKRQFEADLPKRYEQLMNELMAAREELKRILPDKAQGRMKINGMIADSPSIDDYLSENEAPLKELIDDALAPYRN